MYVSRYLIAVALACLSNFCLSNAAAQQLDQVAAERVLGPQWKQLSRRAGMIFTGTVLPAVPQSLTSQTPTNNRTSPETTLAVELRFRVDEAIAGVEPGQILTIHEWAGAWVMHCPMTSGQRILIFLYPLSRLGLTSPVGGSLGQIALDPNGKYVSKDTQRRGAGMSLANASSPQSRAPFSSGNVSVVQLERAIRGAREE